MTISKYVTAAARIFGISNLLMYEWYSANTKYV